LAGNSVAMSRIDALDLARIGRYDCLMSNLTYNAVV
jgi:hypothetical protein